MRSWIRDRGLLLANLALFVVFFGGMIIAGAQVYNNDQSEHGQGAVSLGQYLGTSDFVEATFENWESEFLQMGMYVVLTAYLFQRGSSESKPIDEPAPQDEDPRDSADDPNAPWPVRRGGWWLKVYENSLSGLFFVLFLASFAAHAAGGARAYSEENLLHGQPAVSSSGSSPSRTGRASSSPSPRSLALRSTCGSAAPPNRSRSPSPTPRPVREQFSSAFGWQLTE